MILLLIVFFYLVSLHRFVSSWGNNLNFIAFFNYFSVITLIITPYIAYRFYPENDKLASLWGWFMVVPEKVYFNYTFILVGAAIMADYLFSSKYNRFSKLNKIIERLKNNENNNQVAVKIFGFSVIIKIISNFIPHLDFVSYISSLFICPVFILIYFSSFRYRTVFLWFILTYMLYDAISSSLFGEIFNLIIVSMTIILLNKKFTYWVKLALVHGILIGICLIQIMKPYYRTYIQSNGEKENNLMIFGKMLVTTTSNIKLVLNHDDLFGLYFRMNQGLLLSKVYDFIPRKREFVSGRELPKLVLSVLVPRVIWNDKPEAGGKYNMINYTGYSPGKYTSMNIGPHGEAYANFGMLGFFYMIVFIGLIKWSLNFVIFLSLKNPYLFVFVPVVFYSSLGNGSDSIMIINAIFKSFVFVYLFTMIFGFKFRQN